MLWQIIFQRRETDDRRPAVAERPEPRVDPENEALRRRLFQKGHDLSGNAGEILVRAQRAGTVRFSLFRIQKNQVDVGGKIQFTAAELAHRQYYQRDLRTITISRRTESLLQLPRRKARRCCDYFVGEIGQCHQRFSQAGCTGEIPPQHLQ